MPVFNSRAISGGIAILIELPFVFRIHERPSRHVRLVPLLIVGLVIAWSTVWLVPTSIGQVSPNQPARSGVPPGVIGPDGRRSAPLVEPEIRGMPTGYEAVVAVAVNRPPFQSETEGSLLRQLACQSFLIAAEEELGLITLDSMIGETIPNGNAVAGPFSVRLRKTMKKVAAGQKPQANPQFDFEVIVTRPEANGQVFSWASPPLTFSPDDLYEPLAEAMEAMSRGPFVEVLQKAGFAKSSRPSGRPFAKVDDRMDAVSQFALIRHLHGEMRSRGETAETLQGLVRAYANLGSLTDYHWSGASKAFKARSLLYSQRLIARHGSTRSTLAHRVYALALTGRHGAAIRAAADARAAQKGEFPSWLELIEGYCNGIPLTTELVKPADHELSLYLRMSMADLAHEQLRSQTTIQNFQKVNPACGRAADLLASISAIGIKRMATEIGFNDLWPQVYLRLSLVPELPEGAKKVADLAKGRKRDATSEYPRRRDMISQLQSAAGVKNQAGPNWQVLAELLRNESFAQAWRIVELEAVVLGLKPDASLLKLKPVVQGHRLATMLDCFVADRKLSTLLEFDPEWATASLEPPSARLSIQYFTAGKPREGDNVLGWIDFNADATFEDILHRRAVPIYGPYVVGMIDVSPKWSVAVADAIKRKTMAPALELEDQYSSSASVLLALGHEYKENKQLEDAIRCLKKATAISAQGSTYILLANLYELQGDRELWLQTLESGLKLPSLGLETSQIHAQLATWYMRQGKWPLAKPHAAEAAKSYSAAGLMIASRCAEGMENWLEAEKYVQQASQRYDTMGSEWYFWTSRTGRGRAKDSKTFALQHWRTLAQPPTFVQYWSVAVGLFLDGNHAAAAAQLKEISPNPGQERAACLAAVIADETGNNALRDELFRKLEFPAYANRTYTELSNLLRGVLSGGNAARWDPLAFEDIVMNAADEDVPFLYLTAGMFVGNHGDKLMSKEYLTCAATQFETSSMASVIAADVLRKQKHPVGKLRTNILPDSLAPVSDLFKKSLVAKKYGQFDEAEAALNDLLKQRRGFIPALILRANLLEARQNYALAIADLEEVVRQDPGCYRGQVNLARLLCTCPEDECRDAKRALLHAELAKSLRYFETWESEVTLAWAYAESGQFDKAMEIETRIRKLNPSEREHGMRMGLYKSNQPYRAKPAVLPANPGSSVAPVPSGPKTTVPQISNTTKPGDWVDLLAWTDGEDWTERGSNWNSHLEGKVTPAGIILKQAEGQRFPLSAVIDGNYEFEAQFTRSEGTGDAVIHFPVGIHTMRLCLGSENGALSRLDFIDSSKGLVRRPGAYANNQAHRVLIRVQRDGERARVNIDLDEIKDYFQWEGVYSALRDIDQSTWATTIIQHVWVGSSQNKLTFQKLRVRMLSGTITRDSHAAAERDRDLKEGLLRLVGEKPIAKSVHGGIFGINQLYDSAPITGLRWPRVTKDFRFCEDYYFAHAPSRLKCLIPAGARSFSVVGYNCGSGDSRYQVLIDSKRVHDSPVVNLDFIRIDLPRNSKSLELVADPAGNSAYDNVFWCYPRFHSVTADQVDDSMLDNAPGPLKFNVTSSNVGTGPPLTRKSAFPPVHFRDALPCHEFILAHAPSSLKYAVPAGMTRFTAVGLTPLSQSAKYEVWANGRRIYESPKSGTVKIDVTFPPATTTLELKVDHLGEATADHSYWCYPRLHRK